MTDQKLPTKPAQVTPEQARADARKKADATKFIVARIKASKLKRQAKRPKPRVNTTD